ncbi:hypothetical protein MUN84_10795 [Hymenobacter sp. 5516J-16]|uniref:beta strand repeat-containing protein n=1 Tax=Hymenobacter sp. 5516J-16 TaxID=2932253 RepID=UPI001FD11CF2|nr:hypothetical protein [Hymenobacter sp. 5516J-16]UOQ78960.1 hypothetical protein MUN84_10795 [Hymenobacter sp. 5516J-16]
MSTNNSANLLTAVTANADLTVSINGPETAVIGNPVTYVVTMTNNGPTTASNAFATLQLPANLTNVQVGPGIGTSTASYDTGSGLLTFATAPTLATGGSVVNYVTFTMPNPTGGSLTPVASVSSATTDVVASNNRVALTTSIAPTTTETADLVTSVSLNGAPTSVLAGSTVTYIVAYRNQAGSTATSVVRTVNLPTGLSAGTLQVGGVTGTLSGNVITFSSGPASGATYDVTTGLLTFAPLASLAVNAASDSYTVSFPAPVGSGQLVVISEIASATSESGAGVNRANSSVTVNNSFDVTTSLEGPTTATPGTINTYSVTTLNNGPSAASTPTTQTVILPSALTVANLQVDGLTGTLSGSTITFTSGSTPVATYNTGSGTLTFSAITSLPAGVANAVVHSFSLPMPATGNLLLSASVTSAGEDANSLPNTDQLTTTPLNIAPVAQNVWNTLQSVRGNTSATPLAISPLNATDAGGSIVSYTITSLPTSGTLYYNGVVATTAAGLVTDPTKLSYVPAPNFVGNAFFTYTATDNGGLVSPAALYTIPVAQDLSSAYTVFNDSKGGANPYVNGDVLAQITDLNTAVYNSAGVIYDPATGLLQTGAVNGLPTTGTNAVLASGTLPAGVSLDPITGRIFVSNARLLLPVTSAQSYTVNVTTTDINGGTNTAPVTFTIGARPLPVTLVSFTAQAAGQDAKITWATSQELNNDHFVVERSFDAVNFQAIGEVKGQGTTARRTPIASWTAA